MYKNGGVQDVTVKVSNLKFYPNLVLENILKGNQLVYMGSVKHH